MMIYVKQLSILCLAGWLTYLPTAMAADDSTLKRHFIMGGSADNLRVISKQETDTTFNVYLTDLYKQYGVGWTLNVVIYPDVPALLAAFDKNEIDGYFGTPLDYLMRKDKVSKSLVAMKYRLAPIKQSFLIVARADDGVTKIDHLKNKRLSLALYQDMEALYLNTVLLRHKLPEIPTFFSTRVDVKTTNGALMDVFFNKSDVAIVRENEFNIAAELNPQLLKKLIILEKSPPMLASVGVMNNKISDDDFSGLIATFSKVINSDKGKALMGLVQVETIALVAPEDMRDVENMLSDLTLLRKLNTVVPKIAVTHDKTKIKRNP